MELPYSCYYDEEAGIQIIIDDRLAVGGVETSGTELILYPTEAAREAGAGNLDSGSAGTDTYTHLDVYKRQYWISLRPWSCEPRTGTGAVRYRSCLLYTSRCV